MWGLSPYSLDDYKDMASDVAGLQFRLDALIVWLGLLSRGGLGGKYVSAAPVLGCLQWWFGGLACDIPVGLST